MVAAEMQMLGFNDTDNDIPFYSAGLRHTPTPLALALTRETA